MAAPSDISMALYRDYVKAARTAVQTVQQWENHWADLTGKWTAGQSANVKAVQMGKSMVVKMGLSTDVWTVGI